MERAKVLATSDRLEWCATNCNGYNLGVGRMDHFFGEWTALQQVAH